MNSISWSSFYEYIRIECGISDDLMFTGISFIIYFITYYIHSWLFIVCDWYGYLDRYAIRSGRHRLPSIDQQWAAIREASLDTFIMKPLLLYFSYPFVSKPFISYGEPPSPQKALLDWFLLSAVFSTSLYFIHAALHKVPFLYKHVHKKHHSFYESVSFAAQYHHPVEAIASALHVVFGTILVRPHFLVFCVFLATTMIEVVDSHCGYDVPWQYIYPWSGRYPWGSGVRPHDYHHSHNLGEDWGLV